MNYQPKTDPYSSHTIIRNWIFSFPSGRRILDVGTATGMVGSMACEAGHKFFGVEPNMEWAKLAQPYYQQIMISPLEETEDEYLSNFDVVICGDVLEHLVNPEKQLDRLVRLQKPGTVFIVSVPNVANIVVRLQLLFGRFEYSDRGILDSSHLKFFTRATFNNMITSAGLDINVLKVTPIPMYLVIPKLEQWRFGRFLFSVLKVVTNFLPTLFGYQFVVKAVK